MNVLEEYKVYSLNKIMGNVNHLSLQEVEFSRYQSNSFKTEKEAIQALWNDEKTYEDFVILKSVFVRID